MNFFYDQQIRKYLLQFTRIFGSFTVQKGFDQQGNPVYSKVPARYGDMSRQVGHILKNNSENILNTVPFISCYVNNLNMKPDLRRYPNFQETRQVIEKSFNQDDHEYEDKPGQSYSVTRHQPVPYLLSMNVDIWSSNTDQKLQLLEQILVLFNPGINLHTNQNALDWTSLTYCEMTDVNWSSRSQPTGTDTVIDIATLTFEMPIFINPPVKVQRMNIIQTILTQVHTLDLEDFNTWTVNTDTGTNSDYVVTTLQDYWVNYEDGVLTLLDRTGDDQGGNGVNLAWGENVFAYYGEIRPGISQVRLRKGDDVTDPDNDVIGTLDYDPTNAQKLNVTIDTDTLPTDTQTSINRIVDPQKNYPGDGVLPAASSGQRYLVLDDVPSGGAWGSITAEKNDIIQYNGSSWIVSFDASANSGTEYVTDNNTGDQFEWDGSVWKNSYEGVYQEGFWRLYI